MSLSYERIPAQTSRKEKKKEKIYISDRIRKNIAIKFYLSLMSLIQFCPRASFPPGLS